MTISESSISLTQSVVLGVVQGLSEFLPISSTAHLRVIPAFLGWSDPGIAYSAVIQLGSVLAVLAYFFKDLQQILGGSFTALKTKDYASKNFRLLGAIIFGTIPICVLGLLLKPVLETPDGPLRSLTVIGGASVFMGLLLFLAEMTAKRKRKIADIGAADGLIVGLGQAMALVPGCSRSGSTLTAALFLNMQREDAARFSFLLGIPAIVLSGLLELKHMLQVGINQQGLVSLFAGLLVSTLVSYFAIWWMLRFLKQHSTLFFVLYRLIFGTVVIALSLAHQIH